LNPARLVRTGTQLEVHALDGRSDGVGNRFDVATRHFQFGMPELRLDIARLAMLLKMRRARSTERLVGHIYDACLLGERLEMALEVIAQAEGLPTSFGKSNSRTPLAR
jgi:hypothetical protein